MMNEVEKLLRKECFNVRTEYLVETDEGRWLPVNEWTEEDAEDFIDEQNAACDIEDYLTKGWWI